MPNVVYYLPIGSVVLVFLNLYFTKLYTVNSYIKPYFLEKGIELIKVKYYFLGIFTYSSDWQFTFASGRGPIYYFYFKCFGRKGNKDICYVAQVRYLFFWVKAINYKEWKK